MFYNKKLTQLNPFLEEKYRYYLSNITNNINKNWKVEIHKFDKDEKWSYGQIQVTESVLLRLSKKK